MDKGLLKGHAEALFTIVVWGTTFISTKVLLRALSPVEILLIRFVLGYAALWLACPHILPLRSWKEEGVFALAGLAGITLYYLLENIALTYTTASNVGVIIAVAPLFVVFLSGEGVSPRFILGFAASIIGIALMSLSGLSVGTGLFGDTLALSAAIVWAVYSVLTRKIARYGYSILLTTRRIFLYGIVFMIPAVAAMGFSVSAEDVLTPSVVFNLLYLGLCASALCFVTWNSAVSTIGAVSTSVYLYLTPIVTLVASALVLGERMPGLAVIGVLLTLSGLIFSQSR